MVRGLAAGIFNSQTGGTPAIHLTEVSKKGEKLRLVFDGYQLAYHVLSPPDKDHSWDFTGGGSYREYEDKLNIFLTTFKAVNPEFIVVFPLADGFPPNTEQSVEKWTAKELSKTKRSLRVKNLAERDGGSTRNLEQILPPLMIQFMIDFCKNGNIEVLYTSGSVVEFVAHFIAEGHADAVVAQDTDYCVFENVPYIPLDSFHEEEKDVWICDYLTREITADLIGLANPDRMVDLSIILGNCFTARFATDKYDTYRVLHIKNNSKYPDNLCVGAVAFVNGEQYTDLEGTTPYQEILSNDPEYKQAYIESKKFFNFNDTTTGGESQPATPAEEEPENIALIHQLTDRSALPLWVYGVAKGGDFWYEPILDDYDHPIKTHKITVPIRQLLFSALGRQSVVEHIPTFESVEEEIIEALPGTPGLDQISKMDQKTLVSAVYGIIHQVFPKKQHASKDPLSKVPEPMRTIGYALRLIVAQCYTNNQSPDLIPEEAVLGEESKVVGPPPLDLHEVKALALQALLVNNFKDPLSGYVPKPRMRRIKVIALYQSVLQHILWLQQVFNVIDPSIKITNLFDSSYFSAAYDCHGDYGDEFIGLFPKPEKAITLVEKQLPMYLEAILHPFPNNLFEAFESVPRSVNTATAEEYKPQVIQLKSSKSKFAALRDDDDEDGEEEEFVPPPKIEITPPPPPPKKQQKKKKHEEMNEEDEEAFLLQMAAERAASGETAHVTYAKPQAPKKKTSSASRRKGKNPEGVEGLKTFDKKATKDELKRQKKLHILSWE